MNYITDSDRKGLEEQELERAMQDTPESGEATGFNILSGVPDLNFGPSMKLETFDELMERDDQRKKDGLPGKIKIKKLVKDQKGTVIVVPYAYEEKLVHDMFTPEQEGNGGETGGEGEGEEGDKIGEQPVGEESEEGDDPGEAGQGSGGEHGIEKDTYEMGKYLTEKLKLPNLKDKAKKVPIPEPSYDMNDKTKRTGQFLNKKDTADQIVKSNLLLGRIDPHNIDTTKLIVSPEDKIYNSLSEEKQYQSQAVVFFIRDYSGSMIGEPTEAVCNLHFMIYTWLIYEYSYRVIPRFILHDTEAKEVQDFNQYFNSSVNGGTYISSAYKLMNDIIKEENLKKDYNIYAFQGSDGGNWDEDNKGGQLIDSLKEAMEYCNRFGISVVRNKFGKDRESEFEQQIRQSGILTQKDLIRMVILSSTKDEALENAIEYMLREE